MKKKILISTGGSGGHVIPATVFYDQLKTDFDVILTTDIRGCKFLNLKKYKANIINTPQFTSNLFLLPLYFTLVRSRSLLTAHPMTSVQLIVTKKISFNGKDCEVLNLETFDFTNVEITFFAAGGKISEQYAAKAAKHSTVIDNSSYFRMDPDVPLIVPEVNSHDLKNYKKKIL